MNITVQLTTDPLWFMLFGVVALTWLYLGFQALQLLQKWVELYGQRKETPIVWPSGPTSGSPVQVGPVVQEVRKPANIAVPEIDPASILKRAPKSAGFGGAGDGGKQPEPTGGPEGGDDQKGPTTPACPPGKL